ncbi:hypothetical protein [Ruegeria sp.]|uniref:hypothetical protein n=1 Tax=Ruegeria sp. TaxID=1879320 RepID=UPI003C7AA482
MRLKQGRFLAPIVLCFALGAQSAFAEINQPVTFGGVFGGSSEFVPEPVDTPGFDPQEVFSDENNFVSLPNNVSAYRLGSIPLSQTLEWFQPAGGKNVIHSIGDLSLAVFMIANNGRYVVRLEGHTGAPGFENPFYLTWVDIQIFDTPGDLVESVNVSYGRPKCGPVNSGVGQINSNPLLYAAEVRLRSGGNGGGGQNVDC